MVHNAVTRAPTHTRVRSVLAYRDQAIEVDQNCCFFIVFGLRHLLLEDLELLLFLEGVILQKELVIEHQNIAYFLFCEEVYELGDYIFRGVTVL